MLIMNDFRPDSYDPEALDQALAQLIEEAQAARDCFIMGDEQPGLAHFHLAVHAVAKATHQLSLRNRFT